MQKDVKMMPNSTFYNLPLEKQNRIINSAIDEFISKPYTKTSIDRIVKNAEIPKGSFYQYFEEKKDIYLYVLEHEILRVEDDVFTEASCLKDVIGIIGMDKEMRDRIGEKSYLFITSINNAPEFLIRDWICSFAVPYSMKFYKALMREKKIKTTNELDEADIAHMLAYLSYIAYEYGSYKKLSANEQQVYYDYIIEIVLKGLEK
jgi:AcrR family transcriptional regulator